MFGCIVAGRLVQTNLQQIDVNKFIFVLEDARAINHLAVFLTGVVPFQPGYGASVHFRWPKDDQATWQFLGYLTNEKPSAIYKVSIFKTTTPSSDEAMMMEGDEKISAQLGLSIEPIEAILGHSSAAGLNQLVVRPPEPTVNDYLAISKKVLEHFYNYVSSFLGDNNDLPLKIMQAWYQNIERKMRLDPDFWKR